MNRFIPLLIIFGLVAAACGSSDESAASVNGADISVSRVEELAGASYEESPAAFTQALNTLVTWEVTEQAADEQFGYVATEDEVEAQIDSVVANAGFASLEEMAETQQVSENTLRSYVTLLMTQDAIVGELESLVEQPSAEEVEAERSSDPASWTTVCATHILTETEEEAIAARERIEAGEDFAAVAAEVSTDTGSGANGGDLGCDVAARYVQAFADATMTAPIGEVVGPVQSEFGFHIISVSERTIATDDEVSSALVDLRLTSVIDEWYPTAARAADVIVVEPYGTWETDPTPRIVAS